MTEGEDEVNRAEIQDALGSIGLSAILIFGATLFSQGLGLITRITMARYLPVEGYGNVVIGVAVLNLFGIGALVGLPAALSRYIPRQETADEKRDIAASAFQIVGVLSLVIASGIYLSAELVATVVFGNPDLVWVIRIFAGVLPFYALLRLSLGGFRGYERTTPRVLTQNVLRPALQLGAIVAFVTLGFGTTGIAFAYASAFIAVGVIAVAILYRLGRFSIFDVFSRGTSGRYRELLAFSLPLAASGAINIIAKQSDLILLGILKSSGEVAVYEVAFRAGMFVIFSVTPAIGFLFQPIISRYHANGREEMMQTLYTVTTRWVVMGTFPIFTLFVLFPRQTLTFMFGDSYGGGEMALSILVVGFMLSQAFGLTGAFLTSVGKTKVHMYISAGTMIVNVLINVALIPSFGIVGAAIATATAQIFNNLSQFLVIFRNFKIHPFRRIYVLPTAIISISLTVVYVVISRLDGLSLLYGILTAFLISFTYVVLIFITRSIHDVELRLLDGAFQKVGINTNFQDKLNGFTK